VRLSGYGKCIFILWWASALSPEARAVCGSTARTDLCGGRWATGVPTATVAQLIQERDFLLNLDIVTPQERKSKLKKDEKVKEGFKSFFSHPQTFDPEGCMAEDDDV
jgi:hypothetical protein